MRRRTDCKLPACPQGRLRTSPTCLHNPQLAARRQLGHVQQPGFAEPLDVEMCPALFENIPEPELRTSPLMAADTRAVCGKC